MKLVSQQKVYAFCSGKNNRNMLILIMIATTLKQGNISVSQMKHVNLEGRKRGESRDQRVLQVPLQMSLHSFAETNP